MQKEIDCPDCGSKIQLDLDLLFSGASFKCPNCPVEIQIHKSSLEKAAKVYSNFNQLKEPAADKGLKLPAQKNGEAPKSHSSRLARPTLPEQNGNGDEAETKHKKPADKKTAKKNATPQNKDAESLTDNGHENDSIQTAAYADDMKSPTEPSKEVARAKKIKPLKAGAASHRPPSRAVPVARKSAPIAPSKK